MIEIIILVAAISVILYCCALFPIAGRRHRQKMELRDGHDLQSFVNDAVSAGYCKESAEFIYDDLFNHCDYHVHLDDRIEKDLGCVGDDFDDLVDLHLVKLDIDEVFIGAYGIDTDIATVRSYLRFIDEIMTVKDELARFRKIREGSPG